VNTPRARDVPTATTDIGRIKGSQAVIMTTTTDTSTAAVGTGNTHRYITRNQIITISISETVFYFQINVPRIKLIEIIFVSQAQ
jgi:hypothetical protein